MKSGEKAGKATKVDPERGPYITASLLATSAMTAFSFTTAKIQEREFREPEVLAKLISGAWPGTPKTKASLAGWLTHYAVGFVFCNMYDKLWTKTALKPTWVSGALIGAASGVVGIFGWKKILDIHPNPPHLKIDSYFGHLLAAHVIFGTMAVFPYRKKKQQLSANER